MVAVATPFTEDYALDLEALHTNIRFMIDRGGIVRWMHVEAQEGPQEFARTPSSEQVMEAARQLA